CGAWDNSQSAHWVF
nr:immunoglobulin light chain junction region [Macaca mulatta]